MATIVCKFGGSSVSDADMFLRVREIVRSNPDRRFIVLSAPGRRSAGDEKITDLLYRAHARSRLGDSSILSQIFDRYAAIRDALAPDFDLEGELMQIRHRLPLSPTYAASRGEYLCARLFAAFSGMPFVDAEELIRFHADGSLDAARTRAQIQCRLKGLPCAVIPGFYGRSERGEILTFPRGGSDVSGALFSAMLNADLYENWTDVAGLHTADPRIVPEARPNARVSLRQMEGIARAGAQLLHPDALRFLAGTGIDTVLKNTFQPKAEGTRISERCGHTVPCVTGMRVCPRTDALRALDAAGLSCPDRPLSVISVFGMSARQCQRAARQLHPIHIIHMHDHIQIIIPEKEYESAMRIAHDILTDADSSGST